jgi:serine/threonine protein kinase
MNANDPNEQAREREAAPDADAESMPQPLHRLAERITDETPVDWITEARSSPQWAAQVRSFELIDSIAKAHRRAQSEAQAPAAAVLFTWGGLQILEQLGAGGFGVVYRAYDPKLQRDVALKLRHADAPGSLRRWLEEARHLAQVRHANVVVVHGVDEHDGRAGIWFELVAGQTLEQLLDKQGRLGAREAAMIGVELCQALAAVHSAGLVHGDVKAANVIREDGGRIVLTDFGSVREIASEAAPATTPLFSAPEVLRGEPAAAAADLYSVGVLLYRLVAGSYPIVADTLSELRSKVADGAAVPLRSVRPDLPGAFVAAVETALEPDLNRRCASAADLERALRLVLGQSAESAGGPPQRRLRARQIAGLAAVAMFVVLALPPIWSRLRSPAPVEPPRLEWTLLRVHQGSHEALDDGDRIRPGQHLAMELRSDESLHVYVLNEDERGEVFVLFPVPGTNLRNPLAAGLRHRLPGEIAGASFDWVVTSAGGREHFLTVASRGPLAILERELASRAASSPDQAIEYLQLSDDTLRALRGVGGMRPTVDAGQDERTLDALARSLSAAATELGGLWLRQTRLENPGS